MEKDLEKQLKLISRGAEEIFPEKELRENVARAIETNTPLRVKLGVDPSTRDLHMGHTVVLRKLRQFQDLGHKAVLIIGDGTGLVGDPSGRDSTRPQLTPEAIDENARTYIEQAAKVLDINDPELFEMRRNGDWFRKMDFFEVISLASRMTVARLLERDDFSNRFSEKTPIYLHELIYPIMQGWDSVVVGADIELGGTDQKYNLLVGRDFQRQEGQRQQVCLTMPLLVGTDGVQKMSKSYGNYIGIDEPPKTMFDKIVSIPDTLMQHYFILLTDFPTDEIANLIDPLKNEPLHVKRKYLAYNIVSRYYSRDIAEDVLHRHYGAAILNSPTGDRIAQEAVIYKSDLKDGKVWIVKLISATGFVKSNSEARRKITEGAVTVNSKKITNPDEEVSVQEGDIVKLGKKRLAVVSIRREG